MKFTDKLAAAAAKAMREKEALDRLANDAAIAVGGTPAEFHKKVLSDRTRWAPVIKDSGIKMDA